MPSPVQVVEGLYIGSRMLFVPVDLAARTRAMALCGCAMQQACFAHVLHTRFWSLLSRTAL